jgi:hypothetical protein
VYVTKVYKGVLFSLDREWKPRQLELDMTEALFKLALSRAESEDSDSGSILDENETGTKRVKSVFDAFSDSDFDNDDEHHSKKQKIVDYKTYWDNAPTVADVDKNIRTLSDEDKQKVFENMTDTYITESLRKAGQDIVEDILNEDRKQLIDKCLGKFVPGDITARTKWFKKLKDLVAN